MRYKFLISLLLLFSVVSYASTTLMLDPSTVRYAKGTKRNQFITVTNIGSKTAYVSAYVYTAYKKKAQQTQKDTMSKKFGLIVSPRKFVLKPRQKKRIRLSALVRNPKKDKIYQIDFIPYKAPVTASIETSDEKPVGAIVTGGTVYSAVVVIQARKPVNDISYTVEGDSLDVVQNGSSMVMWRRMKFCYADKCEPLGTSALIPGRAKEFMLPAKKGVLKFKEDYLGKVTDKTININ